MAKVLAFPRLVEQRVIQTRGPGRRPKSIASLCDILLARSAAATQARYEQAHAEKLKAVLPVPDLMLVERQENGTWSLSLRGLYRAEPDRAIKVLRECALKVAETCEVDLPPACAVLPLAASNKKVRHG